MEKVLKVIVSILIAQGAGIIGSGFTVGSIDAWYATLVKPEWSPPDWVFGPAWLTLYTLMGIAAYLVWSFGGAHDKRTLKTIALSIYGIQLALNALWSIIFFGLKNPGLAFAEILILSTFIVATTILFWRISRQAGILLLPYLAWVFFAAYLNYAIWQLN